MPLISGASTSWLYAMSILSYFKPFSTLPDSTNTEIGVVAMEEAIAVWKELNRQANLKSWLPRVGLL